VDGRSIPIKLDSLDARWKPNVIENNKSFPKSARRWDGEKAGKSKQARPKNQTIDIQHRCCLLCKPWMVRKPSNHDTENRSSEIAGEVTSCDARSELALGLSLLLHEVDGTVSFVLHQRAMQRDVVPLRCVLLCESPGGPPATDGRRPLKLGKTK